MHSRDIYSLLFLLIAIISAVCGHFSYRSPKENAKYVGRILLSIVLPVLGNVLIVSSSNEILATVGYLLYFVGMNAVMFALLHFAMHYCRLSWPTKWLSPVIHYIILLNIIQLVLNPLTHHAFVLEEMTVDGRAYFAVKALFGLTAHRCLVYAVFIGVLIIFFAKTVRAPKIYVERYLVIFLSLLGVGAWETYYINSRTPIDQSMFGFALVGLLIYFFALHFRPRRLLDRMLAESASHVKEALFFFDASHTCVWANEVGVKLAELEPGEFEPAGKRLHSMFPDLRSEPRENSVRCSVGKGENEHFYVIERRILRDKKGKLVASFLNVRDNTKERRAFEREQHLARHDRLTDLYNAEYLFECIRERVTNAPPGAYTLAFIDIDDFKLVNDIFGVEFGDHALRHIANCFRHTLPPDTLYGRIREDQFGLCLHTEDFNEKNAVRFLSDCVVDDGVHSYKLLLHESVYKITDPSLEVSVMFDRANLALGEIRKTYGKLITYYTDEIRESLLWEQTLSLDFEQAIAERQIRPYLQPITDAKGKPIGAEILARWIHPKYGFLPPGRFVPIFEKNGMIAAMDKHMWRCACEILSNWQKAGIDLFLSVNISPKDFYFMDVHSEIVNLAKEYGIDPSKLRLEITETVMMKDVENRLKTMDELRSEGFMLEMDDFGSGYSSLNMLKDMPIDVIKIDMAFVRQAETNGKSKKILHNVIRMSDDLGIITLTEGIETEPQYHLLSEMGCWMFQGYYFAKPMPLADFEDFCGIKAA